MKAIIHTLICSILVSTILTSCKKERNYSFRIYNNTAYRIDRINVHMSNDIDMKVEPYSSSPTFSLTHQIPRFNIVTEPLMGYAIKNYSDTSHTYENTNNGLQEVKNLMKDGTNPIQIELNTNGNSKDDFFHITVN